MRRLDECGWRKRSHKLSVTCRRGGPYRNQELGGLTLLKQKALALLLIASMKQSELQPATLACGHSQSRILENATAPYSECFLSSCRH